MKVVVDEELEELKLYKKVEEEVELQEEVEEEVELQEEVEEGGKLYPRVGYFSWPAI